MVWLWILALIMGIGTVAVLGRRRRAKTLEPESLFDVSYDSDEIEVFDPSGKSRVVPWNEIVRVSIRTTDEGPFSPDVFWEIEGRGDGAVIVFPGGAPGESELLAELQRRLDGFDNEQVIAAMTSTSNARFLVWQAPRS